MSRYQLHTKFVGGVLRSVQLHPPAHAATAISKADEWRLDMKELEDAITLKTKILVRLLSPFNLQIIDQWMNDSLGLEYSVRNTKFKSL